MTEQTYEIGDMVCLRESRGVVLDWGEVVAIGETPGGDPLQVLVRWRGTRRESWQSVTSPRLQPWGDQVRRLSCLSA